MGGKKILGIALIIIGAVLLLFSDYIATQVAVGKSQIESAQGKVNTTNAIFSGSRYTKPIGNVFTGGAQKKIDAGQQEVDRYEAMSHNLKIVGIISIVCGGILFAFSLYKKKK